MHYIAVFVPPRVLKKWKNSAKNVRLPKRLKSTFFTQIFRQIFADFFGVKSDFKNHMHFFLRILDH